MATPDKMALLDELLHKIQWKAELKSDDPIANAELGDIWQLAYDAREILETMQRLKGRSQ